MNDLLLIFVKNPVAGKAKTRLAATLGHEKALDIYRSLLRYTQQVAEQVYASKIVYYGNEIPAEDLWQEAGYWRALQEGETLGDRMKNAFEWGFQKGFDKIVVMGSDNARIEARHLYDAYGALDSTDIVIGPAVDGGYYLLGMKELLPALFEGKAWSTASVYADTIKDIEAAGKTCTSLEMLADVDVEADLKGTFLEDMIGD